MGTNMTPIKIPGKNNRNQRRSVIAAKSNKRPRPLGRPPRISVSDAPRGSNASVPSGRAAKRQSLPNLKSSRKMADLEKLPTEILTLIFLFSMNLDLPRASPVIAGKLSSRLTITEMVTTAFSPTWEYYFDLVKSHCETQTTVPGDPKLQSAMLRCKCVTLSILRSAEERWLYLIVRERGAEFLAHSHTFTMHSTMHSSRRHREDSGGDHCWPAHQFRGCQITSDDCFIAWYRSRWRHKTTDDCFKEDYAKFMQLSDAEFIKDMSCVLKPRWAWTGFLHLHPQLDIPESLLQGPWTPDMMEYLFWLVRAEARIHWTNSTDGEVALLGLKNAISTGNLQILYMFQYLGLAQIVTQDVVEWALLHAGGDKMEVITRLMRMFLLGVRARHSDPALSHLEVAGALDRVRIVAQRQGDGNQEKVKIITLMKFFEAYWASL